MSDTLPAEIAQHYPLPFTGLPAGWECVWLNDIASSINPGFASGKHTSDGVGIPHLRPMNVNRDGSIDLAVVKSVASSNGTELTAGDILFNNTNSAELVGKTALTSSREEGYVFSNHMTRIRPEVEVNSAYIGRQLHFLWMSGYLRTRCTNHVNQASISSTTLANSIPLLFPPIAEQTRIVEKLEELLSDLDAGVAELKAAQKKLEKYRQSLLKAAVDGTLTASWREAQRQSGTESTETGARLLERILAERRMRWEAKQLAKAKEGGKAVTKVPQTSSPQHLPSTWAWTSIGECFRVSVGATPSRKEPSYWNGAVPWVSSGEVRFNRVLVTSETITEQGLFNSSTRINPKGSVLLGMIGEGKTRGQVAILGIDAANNQNCAAIWIPETDIPPEYVYYWLWSRYDDTRRGSSGNNQPALNKSIVENIPLPLPPLGEARVIVRIMVEAFSYIHDQEVVISKSLKQAAAQRQNILRAAFSGRLVPQDPNDEPAAILLERIRAERAARAAKGVPRRRGKAAATA